MSYRWVLGLSRRNISMPLDLEHPIGESVKTHFLSSREHDLVVFPTIYMEFCWVRRVSDHKIVGSECTNAFHLVVCHRGAISGRFLRVLEFRINSMPRK